MNGNCADCGPTGNECSLLGFKYALVHDSLSDEDKRKMCLTNNKFFIQTSDEPYCRKYQKDGIFRLSLD